MFGLMKPANCGKSQEIKNDYRLHYCGTCKTIGQYYSQKSRFLLNKDIVFLGQLLSVISGEPAIKSEWSKAYHSNNCFYLPSVQEQNPLSLRFAATLNIILAELKIDDNITDTINKSRFLWKISKKLLSGEFRKAEKQMKEWGVEIETFWKLVFLQKKREKEMANFAAPHYALSFFSETTAMMTGISFETGSGIVGKAECSGEMYKLGFNFGKIVYLLDAIEDYEKDFDNNNFNAVKEAYEIESKNIGIEVNNELADTLFKLRTENANMIKSLPITKEKKLYFNDWLKSNLHKKLKLTLPDQCNQLCNVRNKENRNQINQQIFSIDLSKPGDKDKEQDKNEKKSKKRSSSDACCCGDCGDCAGCIDCGGCGDCCGGCGDCGGCDCAC